MKTGRCKISVTLFASIFIIISVFLSSSIWAGGFGTLQGKVTDKKTNKPVPGALVKVEANKKSLTAKTNDKGIYIFNNTVPQGKHKVVVMKKGYEREVVKDVEVKSGARTLNVKLTPIQQEQEKKKKKSPQAY